PAAAPPTAPSPRPSGSPSLPTIRRRMAEGPLYSAACWRSAASLAGAFVAASGCGTIAKPPRNPGDSLLPGGYSLLVSTAFWRTLLTVGTSVSFTDTNPQDSTAFPARATTAVTSASVLRFQPSGRFVVEGKTVSAVC